MSDEHGHRIKDEADPRRVYGVGETPPGVAELFARDSVASPRSDSEQLDTRGESSDMPIFEGHRERGGTWVGIGRFAH